uniref:Uncharacterized protein n=1 Tax=Otus sunia TaxID=257818 RepID=A0A8C8A8Q8_9STRI
MMSLPLPWCVQRFCTHPSAGAGSCSADGTPGCPPGEEPAGVSHAHPWHIHPGGGPCAPGTFSPGNASCSAHTRCRAGNRILVAPGTAVTDSRCGGCLPG